MHPVIGLTQDVTRQRLASRSQYLFAFKLALVITPWFSLVASAQETPNSNESLGAPQIVDVQRIWDKAPHNAFTDLIRFNDQWFCVFREGKGHVSPDGALRIIHSSDGQDWKSAALITMEDGDLRDAKITQVDRSSCSGVGTHSIGFQRGDCIGDNLRARPVNGGRGRIRSRPTDCPRGS